MNVGRGAHLSVHLWHRCSGDQNTRVGVLVVLLMGALLKYPSTKEHATKVVARAGFCNNTLEQKPTLNSSLRIQLSTPHLSRLFQSSVQVRHAACVPTG